MENRELDLFLDLSIRKNYPMEALRKNPQELLAVLTMFIAGSQDQSNPTKLDARCFLLGPASWLRSGPDDLLMSCPKGIPKVPFLSYQDLSALVEKRRQQEIQKRREKALNGERKFQESLLDSSKDEVWMQEALLEAKLALEEGEIPIGAVVVSENAIIGRGHNQVIGRTDPTAHAEIQAIRQASNQLKNYRLETCTLYVTLEPCPMCAGAILNSRISRVVYGATAGEESRVCGSADLLKPRNHRDKPFICSGILSSECRQLLDQFFANQRKCKV